jgi:hypothetical protein
LVLDDPELNQRERLMKEARFFIKSISANSANQGQGR